MENSIQATGGAAQVGAASGGGGAEKTCGGSKETAEAPATSSTANYFQHGMTSNRQLSRAQITSILQYLPYNEQNKAICTCRRIEKSVVSMQPIFQRERLNSYIEFIKSRFPENVLLKGKLSEIQTQLDTSLTPIAIPDRFENVEDKMLYFATLKTDLKKKLINIKIDIVRAFKEANIKTGLKDIHQSYPYNLPAFFEDFLGSGAAFWTFGLGLYNPDLYQFKQYCVHNFTDEALALFNTPEELIAKFGIHSGIMVKVLAKNDRITETIAWLALLTEKKDTYDLVLDIAPKLIKHGHVDLVITYLDSQDMNVTSNEQRSEVYLQIFHTLAQAGELDRAKEILENRSKLLFLGDREKFEYYSKRHKTMIEDEIPSYGKGRINRTEYRLLVAEYQIKSGKFSDAKYTLNTLLQLGNISELDAENYKTEIEELKILYLQAKARQAIEDEAKSMGIELEKVFK